MPPDARVTNEPGVTTLLVPLRGSAHKITFDWRGTRGTRNLNLVGDQQPISHLQGRFESPAPSPGLTVSGTSNLNGECTGPADCSAGAARCATLDHRPICTPGGCDVANQAVVCHTDADCPKLDHKFGTLKLRCLAEPGKLGKRCG